MSREKLCTNDKGNSIQGRWSICVVVNPGGQDEKMGASLMPLGGFMYDKGAIYGKRR